MQLHRVKLLAQQDLRQVRQLILLLALGLLQQFSWKQQSSSLPPF
jgi:hypothetical protein